MCERYFVEFPPQEPITPEVILEESLALVHPRDVQLHSAVFFVAFESKRELSSGDSKRSLIWSRGQRRRAENEAATILRQNIRFMIRKTKHFGLLLSQLTWVGLLNFAEKRRVLQHSENDLRAAALYIIMLKKEANNLTQFINCLHMTGNHEIANVIESKLELLVEKFGYCEHNGQCPAIGVGFEMSLEESECHGHYLPPKKRKTSADSGFDDSGEEDEEDDDDYEEDIENSLAAGTYDMNRRYRCNIKPLDAVDVIAIINGKEDSRCKVELCKCGHYHQFPKWKDVNNLDNVAICSASVSSSFSESTGSGTFAKYFARRDRRQSNISDRQPRQSILSPVTTQPVEMGSDLSNSDGTIQDLEFTQPRRSCPRLRLRFSSTDGYAEHPDNILEQEQDDNSSTDSISSSFKDKLPRFLRGLF